MTVVTLTGVLVMRLAERKIVGWEKLVVFVSKSDKMKIEKNILSKEFLPKYPEI